MQNLNQLEQIITAILSPNNTQREEAEAALEELCKNNPKSLALGLFERSFHFTA